MGRCRVLTGGLLPLNKLFWLITAVLAVLIVGGCLQVPNNAMVRHVGDQTVVEYKGEILFTFDPMDGNA
jgi:hypothetical protein